MIIKKKWWLIVLGAALSVTLIVAIVLVVVFAGGKGSTEGPDSGISGSVQGGSEDGSGSGGEQNGSESGSGSGGEQSGQGGETQKPDEGEQKPDDQKPDEGEQKPDEGEPDEGEPDEGEPDEGGGGSEGGQGGGQGDGSGQGGQEGGGQEGGSGQGGQGGQGGGQEGSGSEGGQEGGGSDEHVHSMTKFEQQNATCTAEGKKAYWHCSGCNKDFADQDGNQEAGDLTIPKLNHNMTAHPLVPATCTSEGTKAYWHCDGCNKNYLDQDGAEEAGDLIIPKLSHNMTAHPQQNATCTAEGKQAYWHCDGCNKNYLDQDGTEEAGDLTIAAVGHVLQKVDKTEPTCTTVGNMEYYHCSKCNQNFAENDSFAENPLQNTVLQATGHSLQKHEKKEATCLENGNMEYYHCSKCNQNFAKNDNFAQNPLENTVLAATGHSLQKHEKKEATCLENGNVEYYHCEKCDKDFAENDNFAQNPLENTVVQATGHSLQKHEKKEATCTAEGKEAYWHCDGCNKNYLDQDGNQEAGDLTIAKLPHTLGEWGYSDTEHWKICSECGEEYEKEGHSLPCEDCRAGKGSEGLEFTLNADEVSYSVMGGNCKDVDIVIPSSYQGYPVTTIGVSAFSWRKDLRSIEIPESVISIENSAFEECRSLIEITIPAAVASIGERAFDYCTSLENVNFGDNSALTSIGTEAFEYCIALQKITIPAGVALIGDRVFAYCSDLQSISVAEKNTHYCSIEGVLYNKGKTELLQAPGVIQSVEIPDSVILIGDHAFANTSLVNVNFGKNSSLTTIGDFAFAACNSLKEITIPAGVTSIGKYAFASCSSLTTIHFQGTASQWTIITKNVGWCNNSAIQEVICAGGETLKGDDIG